MQSRDYYLKGLDDPIVQMYHRFAVNVAVMLGANKTAAELEMRDMVQLEVELANVSIYVPHNMDSLPRLTISIYNFLFNNVDHIINL